MFIVQRKNQKEKRKWNFSHFVHFDDVFIFNNYSQSHFVIFRKYFIYGKSH